MFEKVICFFLVNCIFSVGYGMSQQLQEGSRLSYTTIRTECNCGPFAVVVCRGNDIGLHPFPYDCNKYIQCEGGLTMVRDCVDGTSFNMQQKICNTAHNSNCQLQQTVRHYSQNIERPTVIRTENTGSSADSYREHPQDCAKYYDCTNRVCNVRQCPENSAFNTAINLCDKASKVVCGSRSTENIILNPEIATSGTPGYDIEESCRANSPPIRAHPRKCWKYIRCVQGVSYIEKCPTGQGFSTTYQKCMPSESCALLFVENTENFKIYGSRTNSMSISHTESSFNQTNLNHPDPNRNQGRDTSNPSQPSYSTTGGVYGGVRLDTVDMTNSAQDSQHGSRIKISAQSPYLGSNEESDFLSSSSTIGHTQNTGHTQQSTSSNQNVYPSQFPSLTGDSNTEFTSNAGTHQTRINNTQTSYAQVLAGGATSATGTTTTLTNTLYEDLQLESGLEGNHMGSVQIKVNGIWYYVCDDHFDIKAANVFCKEIGFQLGARQLLTNSYFLTPEIKNRKKIELTTFNEVVCQGDESSLRKCEFISWDTSRCNADEVVGVVCKLPHKDRCNRNQFLCTTQDQCIPSNKMCDGIADCSDMSDEMLPTCNRTLDYRLVDGISADEGRLQMKYQGKWGTVCDDYFGNMEAKVFCNSKGYYGPAMFSRRGFGYGYGPIWLTQHSCTSTGSNHNLSTCNTGTYAPTNCIHSQDIRIKCTGSGNWPTE